MAVSILSVHWGGGTTDLCASRNCSQPFVKAGKVVGKPIATPHHLLIFHPHPMNRVKLHTAPGTKPRHGRLVLEQLTDVCMRT